MSARGDLGGTQGLFWALITAPEGVRPGLDALVRRHEAAPGNLDAMIAGSGTMSPTDRLDIYANMYFFRLLDCLKEDYPKLLEAIGGTRFHNLATNYLLACPSEHPSLRYVGARLPAFVTGHELGRECPALADLARLEWARADLFDAADAASLTREHLVSMPHDDAGDLMLSLVPAVALVRLAHDAPRLWREMKERAEARREQDEAIPPLPQSRPRPTHVRVWRKGFVVYHRSIDGDEAAGLEALRAGEPLGKIAQRLSAGRATGESTALFGRMLQAWIDDGLLAAPPPPRPA